MQPAVAKKRIGARDHGVAGSDLQRHQDGQKRIGAGGNADGIGRPADSCAIASSKCRYFRPEDEALAGEDFVELRADRVRERAVLFA